MLIASYVFYGLWDWRFLLLIFSSSIIDYIAGNAIYANEKKSIKRLYLLFSIVWNLGVLFVFKYYNFFAEGFSSLFHLDTQGFTYNSLDILLPVGLSFYTFQTMSYSIDVYRKRIKPSKNLLNFLCFVSFFPQLVAGPIERAKSLLPQFSKERTFKKALLVDGLRLILWGLFMKMVVADNAAIGVNSIYSESNQYGSLSLLYATILFFFQIYGDFAGYSNIAIGTAKLFGFKLSKNFNIPYLSRSVAEFWQRWHITLTKWFTDYVYAPLIKNWKTNYLSRTVALFITMTLIGLWHGANWTFIFFGVFQAITISVERIPITVKGQSYNINYFLTKMPLAVTILYSFTLILISCIFFRAENFEMALNIIHRIFSWIPSLNFSSEIGLRALFIPLLVIMEVLTRNKNHPFEFLEQKYSRPIRWIIYYIFVFFIIRYAGPKEEFIYFQF